MEDYVEVTDTTLRDGEQVFGVSYTVEEKFAIGKALLQKVKVDRIEVASALASEKDKEATSRLARFAEEVMKKPYCVEALSFLNDASLRWCEDAGVKSVNLLAKGSLTHLKVQLKQTPEEHIEKVKRHIEKAKDLGMRVNIYLEDSSYGIKEDVGFIRSMLDMIENEEVNRVMLPDTRGILSPEDVRGALKDIVRDYPKLTFDFHGHNDYGLAVANSLEAVKAGFNGVHATVNGMGERAGNTPLEEIVVAIKDFTNKRLGVEEKQLSMISSLVERFSGKRVAWNKPIVGQHVFAHVAGIHADGEKKGEIYTSKLRPERFGRRKEYSLGKLSGKASIEMVLKKLGIEIGQDKVKEVLKRVVGLSERKERLTEADLLYIISDVLEKPLDEVFEVEDVAVVTEKNISSVAMASVKIKGEKVKIVGKGSGGFDAFMNAIKKECKARGVFVPLLVDYEVGIPKGGETNALVETWITWKDARGNPFRTVGVSPDQVLAAVYAAEKAINYSNIKL